MNKIFLLFILCTLVGSCKSQTDEERMLVTSNKVLEALKTGDAKEFENLIGVKLLTIGKNKEMVAFDFKKCKTAYDRYLAGMEAKIDITNEIDGLGHRKVIIPFYNGYDSVNKVANVRLELFFGPLRFVPLNKLSDYELVMENRQKPVIMAPPPMRN